MQQHNRLQEKHVILVVTCKRIKALHANMLNLAVKNHDMLLSGQQHESN